MVYASTEADVVSGAAEREWHRLQIRYYRAMIPIVILSSAWAESGSFSLDDIASVLDLDVKGAAPVRTRAGGRRHLRVATLADAVAGAAASTTNPVHVRGSTRP